jgi:hypothetical protein
MPENSRRGVAVVQWADCGLIPLNVVGLLLSQHPPMTGGMDRRTLRD